MTALGAIFAPSIPVPRSHYRSRPLPLLSRTPLSRRDIRIIGLLALVAILSATDLWFTLFANSLGFLNEMNPIAATYLSSGLEPSLICYKILMILAGSTMLWRVRHSRWALPAAWTLLATHIALAMIWYVWAQDVISTFEIMLSPRPKF